MQSRYHFFLFFLTLGYAGIITSCSSNKKIVRNRPSSIYIPTKPAEKTTPTVVKAPTVPKTSKTPKTSTTPSTPSTSTPNRTQTPEKSTPATTENKTIPAPVSTPVVVDPSDKRMSIVAFGKSYDGTRYKYTGITPDGFDCSGFTSYVFNQFQKKIPRSSPEQANYGTPVDVKEVQPGDLVFFKNSSGRIFHVALVIENQNGDIKVVHSTTSRGVVIESIIASDYWRTKISHARSVIE